jgi:hypothetical protein
MGSFWGLSLPKAGNLHSPGQSSSPPGSRDQLYNLTALHSIDTVAAKQYCCYRTKQSLVYLGHVCAELGSLDLVQGLHRPCQLCD